MQQPFSLNRQPHVKPLILSLLFLLTRTLKLVSALFVFSLVVFGVLKKTLGIRINGELEQQGLDLLEHGHPAYPDFQTNS